MAEVVLDRPRVLAVVGQLIPARVAQHVAVNEEREAGSLTSTSDHALIPSHRERGQALGNEECTVRAPSGVSRWSRRSARNSFPPSGCILASELKLLSAAARPAAVRAINGLASLCLGCLCRSRA